MSVDFNDPIENLKKREFNIRCKVHRVSVAFEDDAYSENQKADLVILEPYEGTERDMLMSAWYGEAAPVKIAGRSMSKVELPAYVGSPCSMFSLLRLEWPNEIFQKPHLMVVSVAMEHLINTYKEVSAVDLKIFHPEKADEFGLSEGQVRGN